MTRLRPWVDIKIGSSLAIMILRPGHWFEFGINNILFDSSPVYEELFLIRV